MRTYKEKHYKTWANIKQRCYNKNNKRYHQYGGRGITICEDWILNAASFIDYIKGLPGYGKEGMSIDRIDNNGNYQRGNLKWSDSFVQNANKQITHLNKTGYMGVFFNNRAKKFGVSLKRNKIQYYVGIFETADLAHIARRNFIENNNLKKN